MFVQKNFNFKGIMRFSGGHLIWLTLWAGLATSLIELIHYFQERAGTEPNQVFAIPWLPVSVVGTAVAFYVGFKNNSAYDRLWEARKIWGAIINTSRMWGNTVLAFVSNHFQDDKLSESELQEIKKRLLYRHIAWLYALRSQLLIPTPWEHISQKGRMMKETTEKRMGTWGVGLFDDQVTQTELKHFLPPEELERLINAKNTATQIVKEQGQDLKGLREQNVIEDFRHMELQNILNDFYTQQGKCERIKKFPLPRQYGSMSLVFVGVFIFLLPFAMVNVFHELSDWGAWLSIPFTVIVAWVFIMMELIGDYSENPFEGLGNDIPMLALSRTIEIDLREMLGETDLPPAIEAKDGVLM